MRERGVNKIDNLLHLSPAVSLECSVLERFEVNHNLIPRGSFCLCYFLNVSTRVATKILQRGGGPLISVATKIENRLKPNTKILRFLKIDRRRIRRIFVNSKILRRSSKLGNSSKIFKDTKIFKGK